MRRAVPPLIAGAGLVGAILVWTAGYGRSAHRLPVAPALVVSKAYRWTPDHLRRDQTLSHMFARHDVEGAELLQILDAARGYGLDPRRVRPSLTFEFRHAIGEGHPYAIRARLNDDGFLFLSRRPDGAWRAAVDPIEWSITIHRVTGEIRASLNTAVHRAIPDDELPYGERDRLIWATAEAVFGWVVDFTRDLRPGDRFEIVYERLASSVGDVRFGRVVAAKLDLHGSTNTAYVMNDRFGNNVYYDAAGRSLHRAFLKYPVQFRRISSTFSRRRFHPILRRYRAHLGYDFAADQGTPIRATGDGVVRLAGRNGGYGIMVAIRHPKGIETRYAHMSRLGPNIRPGVHVTQGQAIGRVGMTGLANGPHVHYEFLKNGKPINYRNIDLGDGDPIRPALRATFDSVRTVYDRFLDARPPRTLTLLGGS